MQAIFASKVGVEPPHLCVKRLLRSEQQLGLWSGSKLLCTAHPIRALPSKNISSQHHLLQNLKGREVVAFHIALASDEELQSE